MLVQKVEAMGKQISERKLGGKRWWGRNELCARSRLFTFNVVLYVDPLCGSVSLNWRRPRRPRVQHAQCLSNGLGLGFVESVEKFGPVPFPLNFTQMMNNECLSQVGLPKILCVFIFV